MLEKTCPKCGFSQLGGDECLRCGVVFSKWGEHATPRNVSETVAVNVPPPAPPPAAPPKPERPTGLIIAFVVLAVAAAAALAYYAFGPPRESAARTETAEEKPGPAPQTPFELTGRWTGRVVKTIAGPPPREAAEDVEISSDAAGKIVGARVLYRDPGVGAAAAGYELDPRGAKSIEDLVAKINAAGQIENYTAPFFELPPELGPPARTWRVIEGFWETQPKGKKGGRAKSTDKIPYILLESDPGDTLCQIGETRNGFLSFAYFTKGYFDPKTKGTDQLSAIIQPPEGSQLASFSNIVWNLSGSTNFMSLRVETTVTGPAGGPDALYLTKK